MFVVYVLHSQAYDKIYIGYTANLEDRLISHNQKATKGYTLKFRPWTVVYTEEFDSKPQAIRGEKELKSSRGRHFIRTKILNKT